MLTKPRTVCGCQPVAFVISAWGRAFGAFHQGNYLGLIVGPVRLRFASRLLELESLPKATLSLPPLVFVIATKRRQLQHHAGVSKQGTSLVGEQIQLSVVILGKAEHCQT
jgi:hypothetical protein